MTGQTGGQNLISTYASLPLPSSFPLLLLVTYARLHACADGGGEGRGSSAGGATSCLTNPSGPCYHCQHLQQHPPHHPHAHSRILHACLTLADHSQQTNGSPLTITIRYDTQMRMFAEWCARSTRVAALCGNSLVRCSPWECWRRSRT